MENRLINKILKDNNWKSKDDVPNYIMILISGGVDSTCLLDFAVACGVKRIDLIYTNITNNGHKTEREISAIESLMSYYKRNNNDISFHFYKNSITIEKPGNLNYQQIPLHICAALCHDVNVKEIWIGYTVGDDAIAYLDDIRNSFNSFEFLIDKFKYTTDEEVEIPYLRFPISKLHKSSSIHCMTRDVLSFITFCESYEKLEGHKRCHKCHVCKHYDTIFYDDCCVPSNFIHYHDKKKKLEETDYDVFDIPLKINEKESELNVIHNFEQEKFKKHIDKVSLRNEFGNCPQIVNVRKLDATTEKEDIGNYLSSKKVEGNKKRKRKCRKNKKED